MILALLLGVGNMWAEQSSLISSVYLPDIPASTLDLSSQTYKVADVNGWVVFDPFNDAPGTWLAFDVKKSQSEDITKVEFSSFTAPFYSKESTTAWARLNNKNKESVAIRFTNVTDASFLVNPRGSRTVKVALYTYDGENQVLVGNNPSECTSGKGFKELHFSSLTSTTTYIAYVYTNAESNCIVAEIALKGVVDDTPAAPAITAPASTPDLAEISLGETKQFSVTATGYPAPTYAWYSCEDGDKTNPTVITGATTASYTTPNTLAVGTYYYYCAATNESGSATSLVFSLKVNPLGADLTAHTPGVYEKAQASGGYGAALITYDEREYETYYLYAANSKLYMSAGNIKYDATGHKNLIDGKTYSNGVANVMDDSEDNWFSIAAQGYGNSKTPNSQQFNINTSGVTSANIRNTSKIRIKVSGYDNFSFMGNDNSSSNKFSVKIDGVTQEYTHNSSAMSIFSFDISTGEHYIEISSLQSSDSRFNAFSLRLPAVAKHHVTYALNGGTGTAPTQDDVKEGATFEVASGAGLTPPDGKEFDKWNDGTSDYSAGDTYTMGTSDVTLTAVWKDHETSDDATLSDLTVGGETVTGFAAATTAYNVELPFGTNVVPTVAGTANSTFAKSVVVTPAASLPGSTTVVVTAENNSTKTYTITFTVASSKVIDLVWKTGQSACDGAGSQAAVINSSNVAVSTYIKPISFENAEGTGDNAAEGGSLNTGKKAGNVIIIQTKPGYLFTTMSFFGKIQDSKCEISVDGGANWTDLNSTNTSSDATYCNAVSSASTSDIRIKGGGASGTWIRNMQLTITTGCSPVTLAWTPAPATEVEVGKAASVSAVANNGTVGYVSNATDVIEVASDGALTVKALGSATITASVDGGDGTLYCTEAPSNITATMNAYYLVEFDAQGGDAVLEDVKYFSGDAALTAPSAGSLSGFDFEGWFDAATGGNAIEWPLTPAASQKIYAHWTAQCAGPTITVQPVGANYIIGRTPAAISCTATAGNGGELTYAWYEADAEDAASVALAGAPVISTAAAMDKYYYCIVTEEGCGVEVKSDVIHVVVAPKDGAVIFNAVLTDATHATYSGVYADEDNSEIKLANDNGKYKFSGGSNYIKMALTGGTFAEGDVLTMTYSANPEQGELAIYDNTTKVAGTAYTNHTLTFPAGAEGLSTLFIRRTSDNNFNGWVSEVKVARVMNPLLKTLSINGKDADVSTTAVSMELATGTELGSLTIVETYISNDNSQVTTAVISNSGNWVEGENTYRVTDKDGDYTDYTITITLVTPAAIPTIETNLAASGTYEEYSSATLSIVASTTDGGALTYQWYKDDVAIEGAESASYEVSEEGTYKVVVKNSLSATNYATATSTACVMTEVMPSGCDELASIPSAEPYQYVQTGEWTLYSITSGGKLNTTNKFKNNAKNFAGADVNAISDQRFAMKFDKNVEHVDFYATASSTRTWNGSKAIQVTEDDIAGSTVAYTDVTANFTTEQTTIVDNGSGTRQYIFRATGIFEAGKTYWFAFNGGLDVFRICYAEALEKPVLPPLSDEDICEGGTFTALSVASASVSEGALSYQWYKDGEAVEGAEASTYQPTAAGTYYAVVTNSLLGRQPISAESNHAVLTASTSAVITSAPKDVRDDAGETATLTVVAVGKNLHYAWKECATIDGTYTDVAGAADAASLEVTVPEGVKFYKVVVSSECGDPVEAIAKVEEWVELSQVSVSESTVWDWANAGENNKLASGKNVEILMANIRENDKTPTNDATFNSQALLFYGENVRNVEGGRAYASIGHISFKTTVEGIVSVEFSDNGNNNRRLSINGKLSESSTGKTDVKTFKAYVPAGEVVLMGVASDGTGTNQYIRISKIEFTKVDYSRDVTTGRLGTICLPNGGKMYGADLYEVAYFDASAKKIFFDEILSGEMEAGMPYVFLPNGTLDKLAVSYTDEANASAGHKNGLYGSYTQEVLGTDGSNYILLNNQYCRVVEENTYVGAYRAYIKLDEIGTTSYSPAPGRRRISMGVQSEQVATGLENDGLMNDELMKKVLINGQLFILRGEKMYDATGRLVK